MVCAVARFFIKIAGPYWKLNSNLYVKTMITNFEKWIDDLSDLLCPIFFIFDGELVIKEPTFHSVHDFVLNNYEQIITRCLKCMCGGFRRFFAWW